MGRFVDAGRTKSREEQDIGTDAPVHRSLEHLEKKKMENINFETY